MARLNALFMTLLGSVALAGCQVSIGSGAQDPAPQPQPAPPAPAPAETAAPAPTPAEPAATPAKKPAKKYKVDKDGRVNIPGNIVFETDSAKIKEDDAGTQEVLKQLKQFIDENPRVSKLRIEGHTDNEGNDAHNDQLSVNRAMAVKTWLVDQGVSADRLVAVGFGERRPIADNSTADGRAQNRRTEFHIAELQGTPYLNKPINGPAGGIVAQ